MAWITDDVINFKGESVGNFLTGSVNGGVARFADGGLFSVNHGFTANYELNVASPSLANLATFMATFAANFYGYNR